MYGTYPTAHIVTVSERKLSSPCTDIPRLEDPRWHGPPTTHNTDKYQAVWDMLRRYHRERMVNFKRTARAGSRTRRSICVRPLVNSSARR